MNIFILDINKTKSAQYHCDKHVSKMILEATQLLCNHVYLPPYKPTHTKHPCSLWVGESIDNWLWLQEFVLELNKEKIYRYKKSHKSADIARNLNPPYKYLPFNKGLTPFAQAMPEQYKDSDPVIAYRNYYKNEKMSIATWKNRSIPFFMKG